MRMMAAIASDAKFQLRHGFYGVYGIMSAIYVLLLHYVSPSYKEKAALLLTFSDPGAIGLILAGGIVLLEKDQGIHESLFVTPLRLREYLVAKAVSISVISTASAWTIQGFSLGMPVEPILFTLGVLLTSCMFTFLSIGIVARANSINGFIWLSQLYSLPLTVPLLGFFDIGPSVLYWIFPTQGSLKLLEAAHQPLYTEETIAALVMLSAGVIITYIWARRSFEQSVLLRITNGKE